jgi:glycine cleavage system transcriptional repressor
MTHAAMLLLANGPDRPGIVERVTGALFDAGLNLEDSRMAILGGEFAMIALITGPPDALARARGALPSVGEGLGLQVELRPTARRAGAPAPVLHYRLEAVALDHPGIVHKLTRLLSAHGVNIARLDSTRSLAPISGTPVFSVELDLEVPAAAPLAELRRQLEQAADAENIDLAFRAAPPAS